jgi:hypothetical protein
MSPPFEPIRLVTFPDGILTSSMESTPQDQTRPSILSLPPEIIGKIINASDILTRISIVRASKAMAWNALNSRALVFDTSLQSPDRDLVAADDFVPLYLTTMTDFESVGFPLWHREPDPECICELRYTLHNTIYIKCHCSPDCGVLWVYREFYEIPDPIPHLIRLFAERDACWKGVITLASQNIDIKKENLLRAGKRNAFLTLKYRKASP